MYNRFLYGTLKGDRVEKMGVTKLNFLKDNLFNFEILYEGINGYTIYQPEGEKINDKYVLTNPMINLTLKPKDQLVKFYETEELSYDEVNKLLERSISFTFKTF